MWTVHPSHTCAARSTCRRVAAPQNCCSSCIVTSRSSFQPIPTLLHSTCSSHPACGAGLHKSHHHHQVTLHQQVPCANATSLPRCHERHHQTKLGEPYSLPEPGPDVAASRHILATFNPGLTAVGVVHWQWLANQLLNQRTMPLISSNPQQQLHWPSHNPSCNRCKMRMSLSNTLCFVFVPPLPH